MFEAGQEVELKKPHPCGGAVFVVLRVGMDFKLQCKTCGRILELPRAAAEKRIKRILNQEK